ncbi:helix-turn-helix domain-containing protein [Halobacterium sp. R2-5]|uniref:TrmB family transcriptional regulator n=1 Tax=Halobacterium sp. R2-5 TaxID=2715751 RepID=UPI00141EA55B|nr:helix-turn-helix domain-containing protein [Halobacterium sp. R2-5]NIB99555.1 TrmB family transcriptional regulator [Halobacterium sp. R2-5]
MSENTTEDHRSVAIEQLERFGLSTYAARTFVALSSLGTGTARDVSQVAEVPRTRVYDAVEELHEQGLVDVQESSPKEFWAISAETTSRSLENDYRHHADQLRTALSELEPERRHTEQRGVWTVDGHSSVSDRVLEFLADAEDEIVYMTVEELLTDDIVDALSDACDRGVDIKLGGVSPEVQERIQEDIPNATMFESLWVWSDTPAGRLMLVDRQQTLASALVDDETADPRSETAIWGAGENNSLVAVLNAIFAWRLDDLA